MKWLKGLVIGLTWLVQGCATSLAPITPDYESSAACAGQKDLALTICQIEKKEIELVDAHFDLSNNPALFDIPLIGAAAGAAALLLFTNSTSAISGVGLGAATLGFASQYFDFRGFRKAVLDGAKSYGCLLDRGKLFDQWEDVVIEAQRITAWNDLTLAVNDLDRFLANPSASFSDRPRAEQAASHGRAAIELYRKQRNAAATGAITLRAAAREVGTALLGRVERSEVDFSQIFQSIAQTARSTAEFRIQKKQATAKAVVPGVTRRLAATPEDVTMAEVEAKTRLVTKNLPNVDAIVSGFDSCAAAAMSGDIPDAPDVF